MNSRRIPSSSGSKPSNDIWGDLFVLRHSHPGRRFQKFGHRRRKRREGRFSLSQLLTWIAGLFLVVGGLAIGWLPGPGGFIAIIGLAVIAQELPLVARMLDSSEVWSRHTWQAIRSRWK